ncbi:MAG: hypothetical protein LAP61_29485 [Acidobacteriia bacterium]|nr:hypothetical protein [Terriglobia bacterium]
MLIKYGVPLLVFWLPVTGAAQVVCALGSGASSYKASADQSPSPDAMQLITRTNAAVKAICVSSCPEVVVFRNSTASNLMLIADAGRAKLVYAPQAFAAVHDRHGDAGIVALVAHALGHALDDGLGAAWIDKGWTAELRADAWAGCTLAKSNLGSADLPAALAALADYPSPSHPKWSLRQQAIRSGYTHCGGATPFDTRGGKSKPQ